jgi:transcriptional antiterminator RfaH
MRDGKREIVALNRCAKKTPSTISLHHSPLAPTARRGYVFGMHWWVVQSQPNRERVALTHLARQGYRPYCPMARRHMVRNGKRTVDLVPLFARYLFVAVDHKDANWSPIRSTRGVAAVLMDNASGRPYRAANSVVNAVREMEDACANAVVKPRFRRGQKVELVSGPFAGHPAQWDGGTKDREYVLLELLGRSARVEVASADIR